MKRILFLLSVTVFATVVVFVSNAGARGNRANSIRAVPFTDVEITDAFWTPRMERNRTVSIPQMLKEYERLGRTPNLKLIEAAAYVLAKYPDEKFEKHLDSCIDKLIADLKSRDANEKWKQLKNGELYGAGHFLEAAVAYFQATGDKNVLDAAVDLAKQIDSVFGPDKRRDVSGHEEVKIGLLKLYRLTKNERYFKLAKFFLDERGHSHNGRRLYGEYAQDHKPVIEQSQAVGHCVRAMYLYTPLAEIAALSGNIRYANASERIWQDAVSKRMYLIGNFGSYRDYEDFGEAFHLPNLSCWNETCSAIGNVFWNHKLFLLNRNAKYIDVMERTLYNGFLTGVSLSGQRYFYQNVLQTFGNFQRYPWFGPNCCPPNVARLIASLGSYVYAQTDNEIYVNLFIAGRAKINLGNNVFYVTQNTRYPWDGTVKITIEPDEPAECTIYVRIPGWARNRPVPGGLYGYITTSAEKPGIKVNGRPVKIRLENGFVPVQRKWEKGDVIELNLPMPVRRVLAREEVADDRGRVALERGPLVYCAEGLDHNGNVFNLLIPDDATLTSHYCKDLLDGVTTITGKVMALYRDRDKVSIVKKPQQLVAVPYYAWANRGKGQMAVWLARDKSRVFLPPVPSLASTSRASCSCGKGSIKDNYPGRKVPTAAQRFYPSSQSGSGSISTIYDQIEPVNSADGSCPFLRLRPQQGNHAWVQYDFKTKTEVSSAEVYWKDDKEYCMLPKSWRVVYWDSGQWKPVKNHEPYGVKKDTFNKVTFHPVNTNRIRLEIQLQGKEFARGQLGPPDANYLKAPIVWYECGIIEWRVE